jgi:hypothetical protein
VQVVCDNLNIYDLSALYEAFAPTEARRIARRVRLHKTPKHGSWLNMAEIERAALSAQCLSGRRLPDLEVLRRETSAWQAPRNNRGAPRAGGSPPTTLASGSGASIHLLTIDCPLVPAKESMSSRKFCTRSMAYVCSFWSLCM